jgi:CRP/FNR family transcriptional regulator, nitrogen oxide reductase regulator
MTAAAWTRPQALELARKFPELHSRLDALMTRNVATALGRLHDVTEGRVPQRLARALVELVDRHGEMDSLGLIIGPPLTRQELAAITGTTLYTVSRLLADWESRGVVSTSRARLRVRNLAALTDLAEAPPED